MTETFTLAHISDVHLGPIIGLTPQYWNAKRLLGFANWQLKRRTHNLREVADKLTADIRSQNPTHIAVTGDLANLGLPAEYETARGFLETLGSPETVTVVPGNHDIYTGQMFGASCLKTWKPYMTESGLERSGSDAIPDDAGKATFPFVRKFGNVVLIGLCSAIPTPLFVAAGELGADQRKALAELLDAYKKETHARVVLIHHPALPGQTTPRRALKDAEELDAILREHGAELVLHGHNHTETLVWLHQMQHPVPVIGVPSASAVRAHKRELPARYNLFQITTSTDARPTITRVVRGLETENGDVMELYRQDIMSPASSEAAEELFKT